MFGSLLGYIVLGLSLSIPIGPINVEMIKRGIRKGFWSFWPVGLGGMSADIVLMFIVYFGLLAFLTTLVVKLIMWSLGCLILVFIGYESIREGFKDVEIAEDEGKSNGMKGYFSGFLMAISNPLNIIFWIGIYGSVLTATLGKVGREQALLHSSAIFIGIALWDLTVATSVHFGRKFTGQRFMKWLSVVAGLTLIGFGIDFGDSAVRLLPVVFK
ncbi:lysine transporter LysE [Alicyclobacillaceae bacterium I2511]|nr:lysine transporter LysE [Alicyclobacillaceae bacterium I2511]